MAKDKKNGKLPEIDPDALYNFVGAGQMLGIRRARVNQLVRAGRFEPKLIPVIGLDGKTDGHVVRGRDLIKFRASRAAEKGVQ